MPKGIRATNVVCSIEGCGKPHRCRGWCQEHYERWRRHGDPSAGRASGLSPIERFLSAVDRDGPVPIHRPELGACWVWRNARLKSGGYGAFRYEGRNERAHRWYWVQLHGPIASTIQLHHECENKACVNPEHLTPVPRSLHHGHHHSVLTPEQVQEIRRRYKVGSTRWDSNAVELAAEFGIEVFRISRIARRISYAWVD